MSSQPIGIFDSGLGGLTVVRALRKVLPSEDLLYLGDTARVPYGAKSPETVARYAGACAAFLARHQVKLLLVACNTASAHGLPQAQAVAGCPVIGAVAPGAESALATSPNGRLGVIGTLGTIRSGAYDRALRDRRPDLRIAAVAAPLLVPLAEEGWADHPVTDQVLSHYLSELAAVDPALDTLILGCTHYPLLGPALERACETVFAHRVNLVDSAGAMARAAHARLIADGQARANHTGTLRCFVTDASRFEELAPRFLGEPLGSFETVDL